MKDQYAMADEVMTEYENALQSKDDFIKKQFSLLESQYGIIKQLEEDVDKKDVIIKAMANKLRGCPDETICDDPEDCNCVECWAEWAANGGGKVSDAITRIMQLQESWESEPENIGKKKADLIDEFGKLTIKDFLIYINKVEIKNALRKQQEAWYDGHTLWRK